MKALDAFLEQVFEPVTKWIEHQTRIYIAATSAFFCDHACLPSVWVINAEQQLRYWSKTLRLPRSSTSWMDDLETGRVHRRKGGSGRSSFRLASTCPIVPVLIANLKWSVSFCSMPLMVAPDRSLFPFLVDDRGSGNNPRLLCRFFVQLFALRDLDDVMEQLQILGCLWALGAYTDPAKTRAVRSVPLKCGAIFCAAFFQIANERCHTSPSGLCTDKSLPPLRLKPVPIALQLRLRSCGIVIWFRCGVLLQSLAAIEQDSGFSADNALNLIDAGVIIEQSENGCPPVVAVCWDRTECPNEPFTAGGVFFNPLPEYVLSDFFLTCFTCGLKIYG